jgi:type I restriction enzyme S subunit
MEDNINIPDGWHLKRVVEFASKMQSGGTPKSDNLEYYNGEIPFVAIDDLSKSNKYISKTQKKITNKGLVNSSAWLVPKYSLLYSIYATLGVPRINLIEVATNQAILNILPNKKIISLEFLYYLLLEKRNTILSHSAHTTQSNLNAKVVKELEFVFPKSTVEQNKIAEILSKVDKAIIETEIIISKYNRIKTGLIQDLLTKGIDEKGNIRNEKTHKFKDSSLGRIPKEWKVDTLKKLCNSDITYGIVQAGPNIENGIPYIRTGDMSGDYLSIDNLLRTTPKIAERFERSRVLKGEIVFALRATIGKVLLVPEDLNGANLTQGTARISANENKVKNEFLLYCLRMQYFKTQILENQKGTTFFEISLGHLRNMKVFYPESLDEQNKIIGGLNDIENTINKYKEELYKLKSIKTGLMQDLLSGKKRVTHLIN